MTPRSQSSSIQQDPAKGFLILLQLSNKCCQRWVLGRRFHNLYPQKPWYFAWSCIYVSRNRMPTAWICFMSWSSIKRPFSVRLWYNRPITLLAAQTQLWSKGSACTCSCCKKSSRKPKRTEVCHPLPRKWQYEFVLRHNRALVNFQCLGSFLWPCVRDQATIMWLAAIILA